MLCHWSSSTNALIRRVVPIANHGLLPISHNPAKLRSFSTSRWRNFLPDPLRTSSSILNTKCHITPTLRPTLGTAQLEANTRDTVSSTYPDAMTLPSSSRTDASSLPLTAVQVSRAAAQTVRLCGYNQDFTGALFVVNSLHLSSNFNPWPPLNNPSVATHNSHDMDLINFGQVVSVRLAAHCFLHGLIRARKEGIASKYADLMIKQGIPIRTATLQKILYRLGSPRTFPRVRIVSRKTSIPADPRQVLNLHEANVGSAATQAALHLLECARIFGQQRTRRMYDSFIKACLMQGEIIVAALLFAVLVKDWQLRQALLDRATEQMMTSEDHVITYSHGTQETTISRRSLDMATEPNVESLNFICHRIKAAFDKTRTHSEMPYLYPALQALANLLGIIDTGQLKPGSTARIIHLLYSCPKTNQDVWIVHNKAVMRVNAYSHFHNYLYRLITLLLSRSTHENQAMPPLDRLAYNALLFYALRHRLSPWMASRILEHMCVIRDPPLRPDITTYNTLIRAGTLLRRSDITEAALQALRKSEVNSRHAISIELPPQRNSDPVRRISTRCVTRFDRDLKRLQTEPFDMPLSMQSPAKAKADDITLTSYIKHLTSTGKPHVVRRIVLHLIPHLTRSKAVEWSTLDMEERRSHTRLRRSRRLKAAVELGPHVLATVIDALIKAGMTGFAERVWILAKNAERASWLPIFSKHTKPWVLSIHAYTSMISGYAAEARKWQQKRTSKDSWAMRQKMRIRGMARKFAGVRMEQTTRRLAALERGVRLYLSIKHRKRYTVYTKLMKKRGRDYREGRANTVPLAFAKPPQPDARFFNAALALFAKRPGGVPRARRTNRAQCRSRLSIARKRYAEDGVLSAGWSPELEYIARDMVTAGYSVPPGYRHIFVGRWDDGTRFHGAMPQPLPRRPYKFLKVPGDNFNACSIQTVKEHGLPIRRNSRPMRNSK